MTSTILPKIIIILEINHQIIFNKINSLQRYYLKLLLY